MPGQVDGNARGSCGRAARAEPIEDAQVQAPAVQQHEIAAAPSPWISIIQRAHAADSAAARAHARPERLDQRVDLLLAVGRGQGHAQARAAGGTVGGRIATTQSPPPANSRSLSAAAALPSITGWMGVVEAAAARRLRRAAAKARGERQHALAPPALRTRDGQRGARGGRDRLRQCGGVDIGARVLQQQLDERRLAGDEGAEAAEGLAQRADQHRYGVAVEAEMLEAPRPLAPMTPRPCASSTISQACAACAATRASCGSGARSPSMLNTPSVPTSARGRRRPAPAAARRLRHPRARSA